MKLLVLTSRFPFPLEKGDKLRVYHQIRELSKRHEVVLCALSDQPVSQEEKAELEVFCKKIYLFHLTKPGIVWEVGKSFLNGFPIQAAYFFRKGIQKKIREIIETEKPDHIFCQLLRMAAYVKDVPVPATLDYMDAFSAGMERRAKKSPWYLRSFFRLEARKLRAYEAEIFSGFDHAVIISEQDREKIAIQNRTAIRILPNGIDLDFFQPLPGVLPSKDIVFVGNLGYFPNAVAAKYLVREILPMLPEGATVSLAGARPPASVKSLAGSQVEVTGWVEDIRNAYANGRIFVAPLFTGSGQQNKILEAMAMGLPCVTTPMVNNAIGAEPEREILLADSPESFVLQINRLLEDVSFRVKMGKAARKFIEGNFGWAQSVEVLEEIWGCNSVS